MYDTYPVAILEQKGSWRTIKYANGTVTKVRAKPEAFTEIKKSEPAAAKPVEPAKKEKAASHRIPMEPRLFAAGLKVICADTDLGDITCVIVDPNVDPNGDIVINNEKGGGDVKFPANSVFSVVYNREQDKKATVKAQQSAPREKKPKKPILIADMATGLKVGLTIVFGQDSTTGKVASIDLEAQTIVIEKEEGGSEVVPFASILGRKDTKSVVKEYYKQSMLKTRVNGKRKMDCDDSVAILFRPLNLEQCYTMVVELMTYIKAPILGVNPGSTAEGVQLLKDKYGTRNPGLQRMAIVNLLRLHLPKDENDKPILPGQEEEAEEE
jgi:hypothetical protein